MIDGVYANISTQKGNIKVKLEYEKAPITVANFINLAEGKIKNISKSKGIPFYDGLIFHRVINNFMIQGGCPEGKGTGGPGYEFEDEFHKDLKHNKAGTLSMANSGSNSNGSQFFITHTPTNWLDGKHSVFGYVISGQEIINEIQNNDKIESIIIKRIGSSSKKWNSIKVFNDYLVDKKSEREKFKKEKFKKIMWITKGMQRSESGLFHLIDNKGSDIFPLEGSTVSVHYRGMLIDGTVFDSSYQRNNPISFVLGKGQVIKGWDEGILKIAKGGSAKFVIPSNLAYGESGAGAIIPPNSTLIFEVEVVDFF